MNSKNPAALWMSRMSEIARKNGQDWTTLAQLLSIWFQANTGKTSLLKIAADAMLYDQLPVVAQTSVTFFSGQFTAARSNMPSGSFSNNESEHFVILGIRAYQGANATVAATDWQPGISDALGKQGLMQVVSNGVRVLRAIPLTNFFPNALSATAAGVTSDSQGFNYLSEPIAWLAQTTCELQVQWGTAPATANLNMRFEYHGMQFIG
jgi:hypothetical protein